MISNREVSSTESEVEPFVSLGMSVYNAGEDLRPAVLSVLNQTFENWELIIIDDGSIDGSIETIEDIDDPRIRIVKSEENRGLATRLNEAVGLARGEFFGRMDQDDLCHPHRVEKQVRFLESNEEVDLLGSHCVLINEGSAITGILPIPVRHEDICRSPWSGILIPHPTWMGKTEWFQRNPYLSPGPYFCEDQELLLRTHEFSRFHVLPELLFAYRVRSQSNVAKLRRTRLTLMRIQWAYFVAAANYYYALLSFLSCLGKIACDYSREGLCRGAQVRREGGCGSTECEEDWEQIVQQLQRGN